ncbi:MAG: hypothetical protein WCH85_01140, partial [Methanomicrobiales archaeon]
MPGRELRPCNSPVRTPSFQVTSSVVLMELPLWERSSKPVTIRPAPITAYKIPASKAVKNIFSSSNRGTPSRPVKTSAVKRNPAFPCEWHPISRGFSYPLEKVGEGINPVTNI